MAPRNISYIVKGLLWLYPFDRDDCLVAVNIPPVAVDFTRCKIKVVTKGVTLNVIQMPLHSANDVFVAGNGHVDVVGNVESRFLRMV